MGDGMTKKHHLLLYSLLGVCLVIAVGFAIAAQRGTTLIINFPGSEKAARECWDAVYDQLDHAIKMTAGGGH